MKIDDVYFNWLYRSIESPNGKYIKLCRQLHERKFRWFIPNDDNRLEDGKLLRNEFIEKKKLDESHLEIVYFLKGECTVFEMMVALAKQIEYMMLDRKDISEESIDEDRTHVWFLMMLKNLGLDIFKDGRSKPRYLNLDPVDEARVDEIVDNLVERHYNFNGVGSLFPLEDKPSIDRREVEIWYQMMDYFQEKFPY